MDRGQLVDEVMEGVVDTVGHGRKEGVLTTAMLGHQVSINNFKDVNDLLTRRPTGLAWAR